MSDTTSPSSRAPSSSPSDDTSSDFRAGFVAILGRPNVGKSTLLNQILGEKLAIVSPRPQTTRSRLLGIKHLPDAQIALVDTPGLHRPGQRGTLLNRYMGEEARAAWSEVDVVLLVSEVSRLKPPPKPAKAAPEPVPPPLLGRRGKPARIVAQPVAVEPKEELEIDVSLDPGDRFIIDQLAKAKQPVVLVLNKIDLVRDKQRLLPLIAEWTKRRPFAAIVPMSAERGVGLDQLLRELRAALPPGPKLFPEDMLTDSPERALVSERIREQIFIACYKEVPYSTAVTVDKWEERTAEGGRKRGQRRAAVIHATIHVEKPNQKGILIGEGGGTLRAIGSLARQEIQQLLGCPVFLELFVRVDEEWTHSPSGLRDMGYNAPTSGGA